MRCLTRRTVAAAVPFVALRHATRFTATDSSSPSASTASSTPGKTEATASASAEPSTVSEANAASTALPGVDLAKRAVYPDADFPATWSKDEPLDPSDPRVSWREHFSLEEEKPYYENVATGEVTYDIPDGFVTRFPRLYRRNGFQLNERGAVFHDRPGSSSSAPSAEGTVEGQRGAGTMKTLTLKQKLAAYGGGGLLWYLIIHTFCFSVIFSCLFFLRIDLVSLARSYGFNVPQRGSRKEDMDLVENELQRRRPPFFKTFVLAIILNKMIAPIQMAFTLATAPFLVHRLEPVAVALAPRCRALVQSVKMKVMSKGIA